MSASPRNTKAGCGAGSSRGAETWGDSGSDYSSQYRASMLAVGLVVDHVKDDGELHRVAVEGDKGSRRSGWYKFHSDGIAAGAFGNWRTGKSHKWRSDVGSFTTARPTAAALRTYATEKRGAAA